MMGEPEPQPAWSAMRWWGVALVAWLTFDIGFVAGAWWAGDRR